MNTTTLALAKPSPLARLQWRDGLYALAVLAGGAFAFWHYRHAMDGYEQAILAGATVALVLLGWFWRPIQILGAVVAAASLLAIGLYLRHTDGFGADLAQADQVFLLKYAL